LKISIAANPERYNRSVNPTPTVMFEIEQRLRDRGIIIDDIVAAAMGLYVSHGMPEDSCR
jgi:hypothetical protein